MTTQEVLKFYGTHQKIADLLGINRVGVTIWFRNKKVPLPRQAQLQLLSRGRLRAEMPTPTDRS
jgi:hypothetical protein